MSARLFLWNIGAGFLDSGDQALRGGEVRVPDPQQAGIKRRRNGDIPGHVDDNPGNGFDGKHKKWPPWNIVYRCEL